MNPHAPKKTSFAVSFGWAFSGTGLLMLLCVIVLSGVLRFTTWILSSDMAALSSAMGIVFAVLGVAYVLRYLLSATEAVAEGFDLMPGLPDPREAEKIFGALVAFIGLAFFAFLPILISSVLGIHTPPVPQILILVGAVYVPMAVVGLAVTEEIAGGFPGGVFPAMFAAGAGYILPALLGAGAGLLFMISRDGTLGRNASIVLETGVDVVGAWLLLTALHRSAVLHRENFEVKAALPFPVAPTLADTSEAVPRKPLSEIERLLAEREKAASGREEDASRP